MYAKLSNLVDNYCQQYCNGLMLLSYNPSEYDPSGNSNLSFCVGADILNSLFLYDLLIFVYV